MPKINAPTVAEHRSAQHAAMVAAAERILLEEGIDAVTPGAVTSQAGLARSTFYEYFPSKDDLLVAMARSGFETWGRELAAIVAAAEPGRARLEAYIDATLRLAVDPRHRLATALRGLPLSPKGREDVAALHTALADPLVEILSALDVADPGIAAGLVRGMLGSGMSMVTTGRPVDAVSATAVRTVLDGLAR